MKTERQWAHRLAQLMTKEEFSDFAFFIDACDDIEFSAMCAEIDEKRFPNKYADLDAVSGS